MLKRQCAQRNVHNAMCFKGNVLQRQCASEEMCFRGNVLQGNVLQRQCASKAMCTTQLSIYNYNAYHLSDIIVRFIHYQLYYELFRPM